VILPERCAAPAASTRRKVASRTARPYALEAHAQKCARLSTFAADGFGRGIRSYCFGFAALVGFLHTLAFVALTFPIVAVPWRRDFPSMTTRALAG
jgi:uncharacterized membrane protein